MKVRAVTLGLDLPAPQVDAAALERAGAFLRAAREAFAAAGQEVQTTRVAGPELGPTLRQLGHDGLLGWCSEIEAAARGAGIEYLSFGRLPASASTVVENVVAPIVAQGEIGFISADLIEGNLPSVAMAGACARSVLQLAHATPLGFGNLRFAATASCPPNIPFLPAAFHTGGPPQFSIAVEAADVVLGVTRSPGGLADLEDRLVDALEAAAAPLEQIADALAAEHNVAFVGIDLSPAPFPSDDVSIGGAIEALGVDRFGAPGSLFASALVTRALRRTRLRRCGFSGLMLPLLEDTLLARRARECPSTVHELLLYSAVCGTGLDTVPLPGDITEDELAGIYLDVAALSVALQGKPLTARLFPVPGAAAGDETSFDFGFFANTRVLAAAGAGARGILERGE